MKVQNFCSECTNGYEHDIYDESSDYCPKCLLVKLGAAGREVQDATDAMQDIEDGAADREKEIEELTKERDQLGTEIARLTETVDMLREQLEKMVEKQKPKPEILTVKLGAGIVEVLQLDDEDLDIKLEPVGKGRKHVRVHGTRTSLGKLLCRCREQCRPGLGGQWARSARAAAERLEAVL